MNVKWLCLAVACVLQPAIAADPIPTDTLPQITVIPQPSLIRPGPGGAFTIDTAAPQTTIVSGLAAGGLTRDRTPTFGFSATEGGSTRVIGWKPWQA